MRVALVARGADALSRLADQIGDGAFALPCDVTDADAVERLASQVEVTLGDAPDIIINNAGVFRVARLDMMPTTLFDEVVRTNLFGPYHVVSAFLGQLRARGSGHFVSIGSIADRAVFPENGAYAPAKYALRALHEVLREELRGTGVRATLVSPGSVDTTMWEGITFGGPVRTVPEAAVRLAAEDVARAVVYAISQPASVNIDELRLSHS